MTTSAPVPDPTDPTQSALRALSVLPEDAAPPRLEGAPEPLVDVSYRTLDSPLGQLLLAATRHGLVRVAFAAEGFDRVLQRLADTIGPRILARPRPLDEAARQLDTYFEGDQTHFDLDVDLHLVHGFRREVIDHLTTIPYGHTASYAALATSVGRPAAVRAVGTACGSNPLPIVIPCHRVVRSDGSLGGYLGGLPAKETLLHLEGAR